MIENASTGSPFDAHFVLWLFVIMGSGIVFAIAGFMMIGVITFRSKDEASIKAYVELFSKGDALRLPTVAGILAIVIALAFARLIEGDVAASILGGAAA